MTGGGIGGPRITDSDRIAAWGGLPKSMKKPVATEVVETENVEFDESGAREAAILENYIAAAVSDTSPDITFEDNPRERLDG